MACERAACREGPSEVLDMPPSLWRTSLFHSKALAAVRRFRSRVENEIGRMGNLGTIFNTVHGSLVSCGTVGVAQTTQTSRLGRVVRLEPR